MIDICIYLTQLTCYPTLVAILPLCPRASSSRAFETLCTRCDRCRATRVGWTISMKSPRCTMSVRSENNYSKYNQTTVKLQLFEIFLDILRWWGCSGIVFPSPLALILVLQAAIQHLKDIAETFGSQWTVEHLLWGNSESYCWIPINHSDSAFLWCGKWYE